MHLKSLRFCALLLLGAATALAQPSITPAPSFTPEELLPPVTDNWATNGGNLYNQRYSALTAITRDNVAGLKAEWRTHLNGSGLAPQYSGQAQILEYEGTLYVITGANDVFALDAATGAILWTYTANLDPARVNVCCGWTNRGVAMGDGKIFFGRLDARLVALDQRTGEVVWDIQAEDPLQGYSITSPPLYYDGMLISGFAGSNQGIRGRLRAYDADTGKEIWTFYTIPAPGEPGSETWPQDNDAWRYGGGAVWQTPTVDPDLGLIYFATGNAFPEFNGAIRAGNNLFTSSTMALDVHTGEYRWHFQQTHHDIWDYDSPNPVILFDAPINGVPRKAIAQVPKSGYLYILDRVTGEPLFPIEETAVPQEPGRATAATQPIPVGDDILPHAIDIAPEGWNLVNQGRTFTPLPMAGYVIYRPLAQVNWPPSSYDPDSHLMYICATDQIGVLRASLENEAQDYVPYADTDAFGSIDVARRGILTAVDLTTRRVAWQQQWSDRCFSGSTVTAGGLLFIGRNDGRLTALDKHTGASLWSFKTDAGIHGSPTVFAHEGKQYVAAFSGGSVFAPGQRGDSLWVFSLEGTLDEVTDDHANTSGPTDQLPPQALLAALPEGPADLQSGHALYSQVCQPCHGETGRGGEGLGAPLTDKLELGDIVSRLTYGRNQMPAFGAIFDKTQIRDVAHYVKEELLRAPTTQE
jgi:alcohol dehydrogenase (cytochrome c)